MPGGDGTGPLGLGPMTGGARGYCAGYAVPGYANPYFARGFGGRGFGRGRGGGRGWRHWYHATGLPGWARAQYGYPAYGAGVAPGAFYGAEPTVEQELTILQQQAEMLQNQLATIREQIQALEKAKQQDK